MTDSETGRHIEKDSDGEVVRFDTKRTYTKKELKKMRDQFVEDAKAGRRICLSDLMINVGM